MKSESATRPREEWRLRIKCHREKLSVAIVSRPENLVNTHCRGPMRWERFQRANQQNDEQLSSFDQPKVQFAGQHFLALRLFGLNAIEKQPFADCFWRYFFGPFDSYAC